jgi:hypothetical protein
MVWGTPMIMEGMCVGIWNFRDIHNQVNNYHKYKAIAGLSLLTFTINIWHPSASPKSSLQF